MPYPNVSRSDQTCLCPLPSPSWASRRRVPTSLWSLPTSMSPLKPANTFLPPHRPRPPPSRRSYGWNDISLRNANVSTPHMDAMAREGILLDRHYGAWPSAFHRPLPPPPPFPCSPCVPVFKFCSPTRCSLQTGRNPVHVNVSRRKPGSITPQPVSPRTQPVGR